MEFALAAFSAISAPVTSALGLAGAGAPMNLLAGTAAAPAAAAGSSLWGGLQAASGLVGLMGSVRAGQAQAEGLRNQAADARLDARLEQVDSVRRQTSLRRQLTAALGERDVAYAASGVDLSFGTPATARRQVILEGQNAIMEDQLTSDARQARSRQKAFALEASADDAEAAGWIKGVGLGLGTAADIFKRG